MKTSWAKWLCLASLGGLVVVAGLIAFMAVPSSEAVRLRNAFLIEAGRAGEQLHLVVRDNGRGLPATELHRSERSRSGVGLGNRNICMRPRPASR